MLSTSPRQQVPIRLKRLRPFSLLIDFVDVNGEPLDLTGATLRLVIAQQEYQGGVVLVTSTATLTSAEEGLAQFDIQGDDLDAVAGQYVYTVTLVSPEGFEATVFEGEVELQHNADPAVPPDYTEVIPPIGLTVTLRSSNRVSVRTNHLPSSALLALVGGVEDITVSVAAAEASATAAAGSAAAAAASAAEAATLIDTLVAGAPLTLDTLNELAAAIGDDPDFVTTMTAALAAKAPLASPALTGNPTAPTPAADDDDTSIATTGFVKAQAYVQQAKRHVNLADVAGIDFTGATNSRAAVQAAITAAGSGAVIEFGKSGRIRCDTGLVLVDGQHLVGTSQRQGYGPTGAMFDFGALGAGGIAIDASAGSCTIEDIHITGPGSGSTAKGIVASGAGGSQIALQRVSVQRFGHGIHLSNQYYAFLDNVELVRNRTGLELTGCYNVDYLHPKIYCRGTDNYRGTGIKTNTVRGLNVWGGAIEDYGGFSGGSITDAAIKVGSGGIVNVNNVYFESRLESEAGQFVAIDVTGANTYQLNVFGCMAYLKDHRAFIDAEGSTSAGYINSGGNKFACDSSTAPAAPTVYLMGTNVGLVVNVGTAQIDSMHDVTLAGVVYIDGQGTATAKRTVRVPRELLSGTGQGEFYVGEMIRVARNTNTVTNGPSVDASGIKCIMLAGGPVVTGSLTITAAGLVAGAVLFTLPARWRPTELTFGALQDATTNANIRLHINTNGEVTAQSAPTNGQIMRGQFVVPL